MMIIVDRPLIFSEIVLEVVRGSEIIIAFFNTAATQEEKVINEYVLDNYAYHKIFYLMEIKTQRHFCLVCDLFIVPFDRFLLEVFRKGITWLKSCSDICGFWGSFCCFYFPKYFLIQIQSL